MKTLSKKEQVVLDLMAAGHTVSAIARTAGRSVKTISTYKARIRAKLEIKTEMEWTTLLAQVFADRAAAPDFCATNGEAA